MLKHVTVSGAPLARGQQLGEELRDGVRDTWSFYRNVMFSSPSFDLEATGRAYLERITDFRAEYGEELRGIAEGCGLAEWELAALNARTEIMHHTIYRVGAGASGLASVGECTAAYFPESGLLGQNWDWIDTLEKLMVLVEIQREDGHRILQLTEPGILGKIGFNSAGVGVCLNILSGHASPPAVPVHILLRAVLDASSLVDAHSAIKDAGFGTCSHLLIADDRGESLSLELYADESVQVDHAKHLPRHTNHYIGVPRDQRGDPLLPNSKIRLARADELLANPAEQTQDRMKTILLDQQDGSNAICAGWKDLGPLRLGTLCSIVMDLREREMHITSGHPASHAFDRVSLSPSA
ncbi:MAG: hypothetical protein GY723_00365 [bacterium]|nr:hypothetical protein [bacterium]MCP5065590.1 hypothetical protein [bacterium]